VEGNYHVARVTVSDAAWAGFHHVALAQGTPLSRYLGRLVEAELERRETRPVRRISGKAGEIEDGLAGAARGAAGNRRAGCDRGTPGAGDR
jgi:hypothetical protein